MSHKAILFVAKIRLFSNYGIIIAQKLEEYRNYARFEDAADAGMAYLVRIKYYRYVIC